jgi:hypothetical protein
MREKEVRMKFLQVFILALSCSGQSLPLFPLSAHRVRISKEVRIKDRDLHNGFVVGVSDFPLVDITSVSLDKNSLIKMIKPVPGEYFKRFSIDFTSFSTGPIERIYLENFVVGGREIKVACLQGTLCRNEECETEGCNRRDVTFTSFTLFRETFSKKGGYFELTITERLLRVHALRQFFKENIAHPHSGFGNLSVQHDKGFDRIEFHGLKDLFGELKFPSRTIIYFRPNVKY